MKYSKTMIEACTAKDTEVRFYLHGAFVTRTDETSGRMVATNGHLLVSLPVELEADDNFDDHSEKGPGADSLSGVIVPREALADARKLTKPKGTESQIALNGSAVTAYGASHDYIPGKFPNFSQVEESAFRDADTNSDRAPDACFNAEYLLRISRALQGEDSRTGKDAKPPAVGLWFGRDEKGDIDPNRPIVVRSKAARDPGRGHAILMPTTL